MRGTNRLEQPFFIAKISFMADFWTMSLPALVYLCIPVLVLFCLGSLVAFVVMQKRITTEYFKEAERLASEHGLSIKDDPDPKLVERFILSGELGGLSVNVSTSRVELDDEFGDLSYQPAQRVAIEAAESSSKQSWLVHTKLQTHVKEHIVFPTLPDLRRATSTGDEAFDRKFDVFTAEGRPPVFTQTPFLRKKVMDLKLMLAMSQNGRVETYFPDGPSSDPRHDLFILWHRILVTLSLSSEKLAERHKDELHEIPPVPRDWSTMPLFALFLSLAPAAVGAFTFGFPSSWMGGVAGAVLGYLPCLLICIAINWLRIRFLEQRREK